jgi:hypothetical protein
MTRTVASRDVAVTDPYEDRYDLVCLRLVQSRVAPAGNIFPASHRTLRDSLQPQPEKSVANILRFLLQTCLERVRRATAGSLARRLPWRILPATPTTSADPTPFLRRCSIPLLAEHSYSPLQFASPHSVTRRSQNACFFRDKVAPKANRSDKTGCQEMLLKLTEPPSRMGFHRPRPYGCVPHMLI